MIIIGLCIWWYQSKNTMAYIIFRIHSRTGILQVKGLWAVKDSRPEGVGSGRLLRILVSQPRCLCSCFFFCANGLGVLRGMLGSSQSRILRYPAAFELKDTMVPGASVSAFSHANVRFNWAHSGMLPWGSENLPTGKVLGSL